MPEVDTFDPLSLSVGIADRLCDEAIWFGDHAIWLGDEKENVTGDWEVVHRSVGGDLYGGTSGISLFLHRIYQATGQQRFRDASLGAIRNAVEWQQRNRPPGSLFSGSGGVAAVLAELGSEPRSSGLEGLARSMIDEIIDRPASGSDMISGRAGSIIALLYLARTLGVDKALEAAKALGTQLVGEAGGTPYPGACWDSDIGVDEAPLCGLAHGASGVALALAELTLIDDDPRFAAIADAAAAYERAWFQREAGNWPDLRELTRNKLLRGSPPAFPHFWCHGGIGIGLVRLRQFEITRQNIFAVEAETALLSAEKQLARLAEQGQPIDLCQCHGLGGFVELFLEGARIFEQPTLAEKAMRIGQLASEQGQYGTMPWPCGVPGGGENPSLMLGLAGIGMLFLRLANSATAPTGLIFTDTVMNASVIVKFSSEALESGDLQKRADALVALVPGSRVERISKRGRVILQLPASAAIDETIRALSAVSGVEYAEPDLIDHASDADRN